MSFFLYTVAVLVTGVLSSAITNKHHLTLYPDILVTGESLRFGEHAVYGLHYHSSAEPSRYEVRVSYPAHTAAKFSIETLRCEDDFLKSKKKQSSASRSVLNIEKLELRGSSDSSDAAPEECVKISVFFSGVAAPHVDISTMVIEYSVILESVIWGLPRGAWQMIAYLGVVLSLALYFGVPALEKLLVGIEEDKRAM